MRKFFTIAIFKIKADIRMNKTTLNSQKEKHSMLSLRRVTALQQPPIQAFTVISIHALLAESDPGRRSAHPHLPISIHALLAESDFHNSAAVKAAAAISIHALLAESDGSRCASTLSLRRATTANVDGFYWWVISIHALLAESDD